ncbi:hypothetical protein K9M18_04840 [Candidatus Woesearchaeota archaeon]|nr:hypothetical protein [Candidatus Woesearchaeota archaeon]
MKKKILKNNDEINKYFNFILELENELKIKSDSNLKYINYCKKYEIQNTDEELVAHAIYTSQIQNKKTTIVTKDYDLIWLLIATKIFMPKYNEKNLNIYMQDTDRFYLKNTKEAYDEKTQRFINKKGFDQLSKINTKLQYIISELPH